MVVIIIIITTTATTVQFTAFLPFTAEERRFSRGLTLTRVMMGLAG